MPTDLRELDAAVAGDASPAPVAALGGASGAEIQRLLADFAARRAGEGLRVAGVIEETACADGACGSLVLRDLAGAGRIPISQDLGPGSTACNLDPGGLAAACGLVQAAIAAGADLVILSKFGKVEADRHGLVEAFQDAIAAELPVVTSVAPPLAEAWAAFAGPLSAPVAATSAALEAWWDAQARARTPAPADADADAG